VARFVHTRHMVGVGQASVCYAILNCNADRFN